MKNRKVIKRTLYEIKIRLASPLCVSGGADDYTDTDIQRDYDGNPFVPGTSLAGALRDYLRGLQEDTVLFGEEGEDGRMSQLRVSDLCFAPGAGISIRDGVRLENKVAVDGGKYDMEILETGASGSFRLELTVREGEDGSAWEAQLLQLLSAVEAGDIRFGANKNRGFGRLRVTGVSRKEFSAQNVREWLAWQDGQGDGPETLDRAAWYRDPEERFVVLRVPLSLTGGISIRKYSARPGEADFEHISCAGKPIVPGTSWNGAIRSRAKELLAELGYPRDKLEYAIAEWFGYVNAGAQTARQSQVVVSESVIEGGVELTMTRNKISRFDASTIESALYQERSHFGGDTELEIKVRKQTVDCGAICGLLLLVIQDIQNGYLPTGGQTAVGRGIFSGDGSLPVSEEERDRYLSELADFIKRRDAKCLTE